MINIQKRASGQSLIEVLLATAVGTIMIVGAITVIAAALKSNKEVVRVETSVALGRQLMDNVIVFSERSWYNVASLSTSTTNHYYINASSSPFTATSGDENVAVGSTTYTRYFYVGEVGRDLSGYIVASGGTADPSTRRITVVYSWPGSATATLMTYLTRFQNTVYRQTDWFGGGGQAGAQTTTNSLFASSSDIHYTTTTGSIFINL